ncbi:ABC transporter substrate-binding protein [Chondromyces apiculatus]|uniref:Glycerol-3-phosphate ABC transporter, periplasmic glycerol-3-phosphate-binding protein n=1 Tax=Chondromyces apiculatus DSM 436 TaxID=1192034 RepID=A0A017TAY4_9BACT|nr:ABC transporter substrate-binding protein [Chondromyces apiculatus]EYF05985.1 Glycerol-3-phosphate ABC transporter, periplasmic glycerol-3-phosphate-binding protein [Chondromyces apiculatus DSM 436]
MTLPRPRPTPADLAQPRPISAVRPARRAPSTSRRDALRALAAGIATALAATGTGCARRAADGRRVGSLWFAYGGKNREVLLGLVDRFHAAQSRYRIEPTYQGEYFECLAKLRTAIAARSAPALTHVVGEVVPYLAEAGVLEPLSRILPGGAEDLDIVPALGQQGTFLHGADRPLVCLPFNRSTPIAYYNRTLFQQMGLAPPTTWDALRTTAQALLVRRGADTVRWGFGCPVDWWFWAALVGQAGGNVVEPNGEVTLGGEAGVRALRFWQTLVHEDRTMKPPPGRDYNAWQAVNTDFLAGKVALIWTSTAFLRYLEDNAAKGSGAFEVGAAPLPRGVRASVPTGGTLFVMPRGAAPDAQEAAAAFLRWMMEPEQANHWATQTGYLPVSRGGLDLLERQGFYAAHPNDRVAVDQLAVAAAWPWSPALFRVQREAVQPRLEEAVLVPRDAEAALDEARRAAREP